MRTVRYHFTAFFSLLIFFSQSFISTAQTVPPFGKTATFAILAGTTVTGTSADTITGDIGISPGTSLTGFPPAVVFNGKIYTGPTTFAATAQKSAQIIYDNLMGQVAPAANNLTGLILGQTAGAVTLKPGIYFFSSTAQLTGTLTLDDGGDPNAIYIFQIGTSFNSAAGSQVVMTSGGYGKNVFWVMGSSATMGTKCTLLGNLVAHTSVSMNPGAYSTGKILALTGAITVNGTNVDAFPIATTRIWIGGGRTRNWTDPANWYGKTPPTSTMDVEINTTDTLVINSAATVNNLQIDNPGTVIKITTGDTLKIKGNLTLNSGTIITASAFPIVSGATDLSGGNVIFNGTTGTSIPSYNYKNLEIDNTGTSTVNSNLTISNNLILKSGTLDLGTHTLTVGGNLIDSAAFITSGGSLILNGSFAQTLSGAYFKGNTINNLSVRNTSGLTLTSPLNITGLFSPSSGQVTTNGYLTLISTASQTAAIDGSAAGTIVGKLTMQRYLPKGFGYKYISSPFSDITVQNLSAVVDFTAKFPNLYSYSENLKTSGFVTDTTMANPLIPMTGYAADFGPDSLSKTLNLYGTVNNGAINLTLYNTNQPFTQGFNLVGNPYPSAIDWNSSFGWANSNIDNAIYFFDSGSISQYTGGYSTFVNSISSDGIATNIIGSMQGFFVHVSNGTYPVTGTLAINNSARVNSLVPVFHKATFTMRDKSADILRLSMHFTDRKIQTDADPLVIYMAENATGAFNKKTDAIKMMNGKKDLPDFYMPLADQQNLAIKAVSKIDATTKILLGINLNKSGDVTLLLDVATLVNSNLHTVLSDALTGTEQDLTEKPTFSVFLKKGCYNNRFTLKFKPATVIASVN